MFNSVENIAAASCISCARSFDDASVQDDVNHVFHALDPLTVGKDCDVEGALRKLVELSRNFPAERLALELLSRLADISSRKKYVNNDIVILTHVINDVCVAPGTSSLDVALRARVLVAVREYFPDLSDCDFDVAQQSNLDKESVSFNRLLPMLGMTSQSYGYIGKLFLLGAAKQVLNDERYEKCKMVILDEAPSDEALNMSQGKYYENYLNKYESSLDEPYDKNNLV